MAQRIWTHTVPAAARNAAGLWAWYSSTSSNPLDRQQLGPDPGMARAGQPACGHCPYRRFRRLKKPYRRWRGLVWKSCETFGRSGRARLASSVARAVSSARRLFVLLAQHLGIFLLLMQDQKTGTGPPCQPVRF